MTIDEVLDGHDCHLSPEDSCICTAIRAKHIDSVDCECGICIHAYDESTDLENESMDILPESEVIN